MGWNGSGTFNRTDGTRTGTQVWQDADSAGVKIRADDHDTHDQDIADGLENTVAIDGQNTTTTDNAILRYDSANSQFEGVTISASQLVGRTSTGDTRGISTATARSLIGVGSTAPTNNQFLYWASASGQYVQATAATARSLIGLGTAAPTNSQALFYASASSEYQQKSAATARSLLGLGTAAPSNRAALFFASSSSTYQAKQVTRPDFQVDSTSKTTATWNFTTSNNELNITTT